MKILIIKTSAIGDVIHTLPALNCLRKKYPEARIDWLVEEAASEAVIGHRSVDNVLISRRKWWIGLWKNGQRGAAWRGFWDFVQQLRTIEYDLVIDFQGLLKSSIFVFLARAKRKAGFGRGMEHAEGSWLFLNERIQPVDMNEHALTRELLLLDALGIPCKEIIFDFPVGGNHQQAAAALLTENGIDLTEPVVAINPMTTWPTKHWYSDRFAHVADQLAARGYSIVFTGGPGDAPAIEAIISVMKERGVSLAGKTTLKMLAALYQRVAVVISTDTGPMHIAVAVGTPVVALFGPTAPWRTGPYGDAHRVVRVDLDCSPCLKKKCDLGHLCMSQLGVDQVMEAAHAVLKV